MCGLSDFFQNDFYATNYFKDSHMSQHSGTPLVPHVKIEGGRNRLSSELTAISEYEIPEDPQWEFARER